ncbi:ATP-binding protein [Iodobacter sp. CM08]|uniref:ATP-binding protein n=1 Tax=Iodobacter sp. CM08 TaxID=3085902 RepID=UPI00298100B9|nr:ATP-binding protein [Iodobacter sp. CM08]MDW5416728.1 ATP-binding protein [Iodobacter sp. CM08]
MIEMLLNSNAVYRPWPVFYKDKKYVGQKFDMPSCCTDKCFLGSNTSCQCEHGFSFLKKKIGGFDVVIAGVYEDIDLVSKWFRPYTKGRKFTSKDIDAWAVDFSHLLRDFNKQKEVAFSDSMRPLHEISKWSGQVYSIAHRMISTNSTASFEDDFSKASSDKKAIFKSSKMLVDSFDSISIYFNTESAAYGKKRPTDVYRLVHKIAIILGHAEASASNRKIKILGESRRNYDVFESFKIIPLSLLQNAIKYSSSKDIEVKFEENINSLKVIFLSYGPLISNDEKNNLFNKGFRGKWASQIHHEGMGMGLYTAKIVADANNIDLVVISDYCGYDVSCIPQACNRFELTFKC